ncbi:hypothetical protein GCM10027414_15320 [Humibacter ginsengiterrae]
MCTWHETIEAIEGKIATTPGGVLAAMVTEEDQGTGVLTAVGRSSARRRDAAEGGTDDTDVRVPVTLGAFARSAETRTGNGGVVRTGVRIARGRGWTGQRRLIRTIVIVGSATGALATDAEARTAVGSTVQARTNAVAVIAGPRTSVLAVIVRPRATVVLVGTGARVAPTSGMNGVPTVRPGGTIGVRAAQAPRMIGGRVAMVAATTVDRMGIVGPGRVTAGIAMAVAIMETAVGPGRVTAGIAMAVAIMETAVGPGRVTAGIAMAVAIMETAVGPGRVTAEMAVAVAITATAVALHRVTAGTPMVAATTETKEAPMVQAGAASAATTRAARAPIVVPAVSGGTEGSAKVPAITGVTATVVTPVDMDMTGVATACRRVRGRSRGGETTMPRWASADSRRGVCGRVTMTPSCPNRSHRRTSTGRLGTS